MEFHLTILLEEGMKFISEQNIHWYQCLLFFDK